MWMEMSVIRGISAGCLSVTSSRGLERQYVSVSEFQQLWKGPRESLLLLDCALLCWLCSLLFSLL